MLLKKYVKEYWCEGSKHFKGPEASEQDKAMLRSGLLQGLKDRDSRMRTAIGVAVAGVAKWDWPSRWPGLMPQLIGMIQARHDPLEVQGAVRCLAMFADDMDETTLPQLVPALFPELLHIVTSPDSYGACFRRENQTVASGRAVSDLTACRADAHLMHRALGIVNSVVGQLGTMSGKEQRQCRDLLAQQLPAFFPM